MNVSQERYSKMKKFLAATILTVTVSALSLSAQTTQQQPPQPPTAADHAQHHVERLTTLLSLSAAQQQQATTIFSNAASSEDTTHQSMRTAHESLEAAVKSNNVSSIDQIAAQIGSLTTQMVANEAKAQAAFYQILTPDQQSKLSQVGMHGHEFHGPGMMGQGPR
jgi:Spy/CpxP family protein refolding chaperone